METLRIVILIVVGIWLGVGLIFAIGASFRFKEFAFLPHHLSWEWKLQMFIAIMGGWPMALLAFVIEWWGDRKEKIDG